MAATILSDARLVTLDGPGWGLVEDGWIAIEDGRIAALGTPSELKAAFDAPTLDDVFLRLARPDAAPASPDVVPVLADGGIVPVFSSVVPANAGTSSGNVSTAFPAAPPSTHASGSRRMYPRLPLRGPSVLGPRDRQAGP